MAGKAESWTALFVHPQLSGRYKYSSLVYGIVHTESTAQGQYPDHQLLLLQKFTAFNLDEFVAGKSKSWTFWNCDPSEFPWSYATHEYAYVIAGQFYVTYNGEL